MKANRVSEVRVEPRSIEVLRRRHVRSRSKEPIPVDGRKPSAPLVRVLVKGQHNLFEVVLALDTGCSFARHLDGWEQQPHEDRDDGDHDQQLDQRETTSVGRAIRWRNHTAEPSLTDSARQVRLPAWNGSPVPAQQNATGSTTPQAILASGGGAQADFGV
jgi:hypothetical protein